MVSNTTNHYSRTDNKASKYLEDFHSSAEAKANVFYINMNLHKKNTHVRHIDQHSLPNGKKQLPWFSPLELVGSTEGT